MITTKDGLLTYVGDTFEIRVTRYSDPERLNLARNAARYLAKPDVNNIRRPLNILRMGHVPAIFRGEHVEFEFHGVSKEVYDHLIVYMTADLRVSGGNRANTSDDVTYPSDKMKDEWRVKQMVDESFNRYEVLLETGETPQVARSAMPVAAKLNTFVYQWNFLTLGASIFPQRIWQVGAQGNTKKVVQGLWELCRFHDNELWDAFYECCGVPAIEWSEVRRKLGKKKVTLGQMFNMLADLQYKANQEGNLDEVGEMLLEDFLKKEYGKQHSMW